MPRITRVEAKPILDSRGEETLEVELECGGVSVKASVPKGKSAGKHEVKNLPVNEAVETINSVIAPAILGQRASCQEEIDLILIRLDGTFEKEKLGGNAILAVSLACARGAAKAKNLPLWKHLRNLSGLKVDQYEDGFIVPRLYMNLINGGMHAGNNLEFQEYILIPKTSSYSGARKIGEDILGFLKDNLPNEGVDLPIGDEGGYAPNFRDNSEPFEYLLKAAQSLGIEDRVDLGMDAAANSIKWPAEKMHAFYSELRQKFPLIYLEDPFGEDELGEFKKIKAELSDVLIAGDDLTVTNVSRMSLARDNDCANAVIIKPNQIGTISETLHAVKLARNFGWKVVVSHRSGETNDDFISDLAVGVGADGFKLGAPSRPERIAKFDRLIEIEKELN